MIKYTNGYNALKNNRKSNYPNKVIVHHTGGTDADPYADTSSHSAFTVEKYHISKGWGAMGYHYFIEKDGSIWAGRPEWVEGAHTIGQNTSSIGICFAGNFDITLPTKEQEDSFKEIYATIKKQYREMEILPHRTFAKKTCYGRLLSDDYAHSLVTDTAVDKIVKQIGFIRNLLALLRGKR